MEPDSNHELLSECVKLFSTSGATVIVDGIGQVELGDLRLTHIDCHSDSSFMAVRHEKRVQRRSGKWSKIAYLVRISLILAIGLGIVTVGGVGGATFGVLGWCAGMVVLNRAQRRRRFTVDLSDSPTLEMSRGEALATAIVADKQGWALHLHLKDGLRVLRGTDALTVLARIIPTFQPFSPPETVHKAVNILSKADDMNAVINEIARVEGKKRSSSIFHFGPHTWTIWALEPEARLALEMIATNEHERKLAKVEVSVLQRRFEQAKEIASIIDHELS